MINRAFFLLAIVILTGTTGILGAFFPRIIPRMINAYWSYFGVKTRVAIEEYERISVRFVGACFIILALIALIGRWSDIWAGIVSLARP